MTIIRFLKALGEWLFIPHGYLPFRITQGRNNRETLARLYTVKNTKAKVQICTWCRKEFIAIKSTPTCQNPICFFSYRIKKRRQIK